MKKKYLDNSKAFRFAKIILQLALLVMIPANVSLALADGPGDCMNRWDVVVTNLAKLQREKQIFKDVSFAGPTKVMPTGFGMRIDKANMSVFAEAIGLPANIEYQTLVDGLRAAGFEAARAYGGWPGSLYVTVSIETYNPPHPCPPPPSGLVAKVGDFVGKLITGLRRAPTLFLVLILVAVYVVVRRRMKLAHAVVILLVLAIMVAPFLQGRADAAQVVRDASDCLEPKWSELVSRMQEAKTSIGMRVNFFNNQRILQANFDDIVGSATRFLLPISRQEVASVAKLFGLPEEIITLNALREALAQRGLVIEVTDPDQILVSGDNDKYNPCPPPPALPGGEPDGPPVRPGYLSQKGMLGSNGVEFWAWAGAALLTVVVLVCVRRRHHAPDWARILTIILVSVSLLAAVIPAGVVKAEGQCDEDAEFASQRKALAALGYVYGVPGTTATTYVAHVAITGDNLLKVAQVFHVEPVVIGEEAILSTAAEQLVSRLSRIGLQDSTIITRQQTNELLVQIKVVKGKYDPCPPPPALPGGEKVLQQPWTGLGYSGGNWVMALSAAIVLAVVAWLIWSRRWKLARVVVIFLIIVMVPPSLCLGVANAEAATVQTGGPGDCQEPEWEDVMKNMVGVRANNGVTVNFFRQTELLYEAETIPTTADYIILRVGLTGIEAVGQAFGLPSGQVTSLEALKAALKSRGFRIMKTASADTIAVQADKIDYHPCPPPPLGGGPELRITGEGALGQELMFGLILAAIGAILTLSFGRSRRPQAI